jgi:phosphoadenosine phosphosulfate reductase
MLQLAIECLDPKDFEVINSHTTVDAPDTVYYIRDKFKELESMGIKAAVYYPHDKQGNPISMWSLIVDRQIPPTRFARYCCAKLKEASVPNRFVATGVREAESVGRRGRDSFQIGALRKADAKHFTTEHVREVYEDDKLRRLNGGGIDANEEGIWDCTFITKAKRKDDLICSPIYKWTDSEIWEYINDRELKHNPLYDKGFKRVGCIGCPLAGGKEQLREFALYPKYKENYIKAFDRMLERRKTLGKDDVTGKSGLHRWTDGEAVYRWWIMDDTIPG